MSTIEKLTIQGIRSFGSKAEDMQVITFSPPLTLILGDNGCGKTTIIECLKHGLTGECPPGSDRGKNFVHDPKIFHQGDTLGQIKLQVRNIRGDQLSVCRSMKLSHRRNKLTFETLDATLNYMSDAKNPGSSKESMSKRCGDVNVEMCQFMGVSKAIINNVLFCHQEDSNWPLDEAKKLKEKFDAIFGITEYNKAIEILIKLRKKESENLKIKGEQLRLLEHLKQEAENKTLSLENAKSKRDSIEKDCALLEEEMKPVHARLTAIRAVELEIGKYQEHRGKLEAKLQNCDEQINNLKKHIKTPFEGDLDALDREIQTFDERMSEKRFELRESEENLNRISSEQQKLQKTLIDLDKNRCMLVQQRQNEQECTTKRAAKMKTLCSELKLTLNVDLEQEILNVANILDDIQDAMLSEECKITEMSALHDAEDQKRQAAIDTLRVDLTKLEENISSKQKQKQENDKELNTLEGKITEIETSAARLKRLTNEIQQVEACYEKASKTINQEERRQKISDSKTKILQLQEQFRKIDERLTFLNSISKAMTEINLKVQELEKKEQEVRRIKSKHIDNLRTILKKNPESNFRRSIQDENDKLINATKDLNNKINAFRLKQQSLQIQRKNLKDEIGRMEKDLEDSKEKIFEKCHSTPYEELLLKYQATLSKLQLENGALKSADDMYKQYIRKITEDPCCPLCTKSLSESDASELSSDLSDKIRRLPETIKQTERQLKEEQKKYESLLQLKPVIEKVANLEINLPKKKEESKEIQEKLSNSSNEIESLQMALLEPNNNLNLINDMLGDMSLLDEAIKDVNRLKSDVNKLKSKLPADAEDSVSIDDLQIEKSTISAELEEERHRLEKMQNEYEKSMEALNRLREQKNALRAEQIKLQEGVQSLPQLQDRQKQLILTLETIANEVKTSKNNLQPLKQKLSNAISEKSRLKDENRKKVAELQKNFDKQKTIDQEMQRLHEEVLQYQEMNLAEQLTQLRESIKTKKSESDKTNKEIIRLRGIVEQLKTECLTQETLKRDLKDNRQLKSLEERKMKVNEEYEKLTKQLGDLNWSNVSREKVELLNKCDEATKRRGEFFGKIGEINNQIERIQQELNDPKYKKSLRNYRRACNEVEVIRCLINDLNCHYRALEWSLMSFHTEKMERINKLIREYWRLIYRGNDIDYIQIQTEDGGSHMKTDSDRRRSYSYRVIQSKNNIEIEMRGRCSAGQRVLASLIIRMALAETFSSNCAVLALDEPTTNLDQKNIVSLCDALNRIVDDRQTQSNFMLIVITHDDQFINALGKIDSYHRVSRNSECKSIIRSHAVT